MTQNKPSVLILGGTGHIGRNLVHFLVQNDLAEQIRVADKVIPSMAWLNENHKKSFAKVEFKHANLINSNSVHGVFKRDDGGGFDFVINCAAETKLGQSEAVYKDGIEKLSCNCANEAASTKVKRYIELSSAHMQDSDKTSATDQTVCKPWQSVAVHKLAVEKQLASVKGLNYVVVRPSLVYGVGGTKGVIRRMVIAAIYKKLNEKMQLLWSKELYINTVHVDDVARALWHLCYHGNSGDVFNLSDKSDTTQGSLTALLSQLFDINYEFLGTLASSIAKLSLEEIAEEINEKHTVCWGEVCSAEGINNTPLTPLVHEEHLLNKNLNVDGSKIEETGFQYEKPQVTLELLQEIIKDYIDMKLFPKSLVSK